MSGDEDLAKQMRAAERIVMSARLDNTVVKDWAGFEEIAAALDVVQRLASAKQDDLTEEWLLARKAKREGH